MFQLSSLAGDAVPSYVADMPVACSSIPVLTKRFTKIIITFGHMLFALGLGWSLLTLARRVIASVVCVPGGIAVVTSLPGLAIVVTVASNGEIHPGNVVTGYQVLHTDVQTIQGFKAQLFPEVSAVCLEDIIDESV